MPQKSRAGGGGVIREERAHYKNRLPNGVLTREGVNREGELMELLRYFVNSF